MNQTEYANPQEDENPYTNDYSSVPPEMAKFLVPHAAEGPNTHILSVRGTNFEMLVSFDLEGKDFYITGVEEATNVGAIVWGVIADDSAKIKHIELAKAFRGTGVGKALLADLEEQLRSYGIRTTYSAFYKPDTIEFFIKNGYKIVPLSSVAEGNRQQLEMEPEDFDERVSSEDDYRALKATEGNKFKKILMVKEIDKKG